MKLFAEQHELQLELVELDDIGWDRADTRGEQEIVLELDPEDLQAVGRRLHRRMQECIAEEAGYFDDDDMRDIPLPSSADFLVQEPRLLATYLEDSFWSRDAILAVMKRVDAQRDHGTPRYWIQDFRSLKVTDGAAALTLGVHFGPLYLNSAGTT